MVASDAVHDARNMNVTVLLYGLHSNSRATSIGEINWRSMGDPVFTLRGYANAAPRGLTFTARAELLR